MHNSIISQSLNKATFRIPDFVRLDLNREDIGSARRDLARFGSRLYTPQPYVIDFAGLGLSSTRATLVNKREYTVIPFTSYCSSTKETKSA